jgi:hypothetical protein
MISTIKMTVTIKMTTATSKAKPTAASATACIVKIAKMAHVYVNTTVPGNVKIAVKIAVMIHAYVIPATIPASIPNLPMVAINAVNRATKHACAAPNYWTNANIAKENVYAVVFLTVR